MRILIAKPGLDGHERGARIVARALADAGHEVIYTGIRQTAEMIAATAAQEDVDAIGLSVLSGAHLTLSAKVVDELRKRNMDDVLVVLGGAIPRRDLPALQQVGIRAVFGPGSRLTEIVDFFRSSAPAEGRQ